MTRILFLIHDLHHGGAEKVLVNLVNNLNPEKFDIAVMALFGGGVNEQFLKPHIRYQTVFPRAFPGNSHVMKLLSPKQLHKWFIREKYDIEVSYLEGPSARIISGCPDEDTKLISWIHIEQHTKHAAARSFRSYAESSRCYQRFHQTVCVSEYVKNDFQSIYPELKNVCVLYNTNETGQIIEKSKESIEENLFHDGEFRLCGVAKLVRSKGFDRMIRIQRRLCNDALTTRLYILGEGPVKTELQRLAMEEGVMDTVTFMGYQTNPYKYVAACDLFVCASLAEGFSTAATEALIVGTPVCTTDVSGMKEMLGENNEFGVVVPNDEEALYQGIKRLLDDPALLAHYKKQAALRGRDFRTEETVRAVEEMLLNL